MSWTNPTSPNLPDFLLFVANNMGIPAAALPITITAPSAPGLAANASGGSLPSGTVYVVITYVTAYGETTASPEASVAVTGPTGQVVVASPAAQTAVTGYKVYAGTVSGAEVLQTAQPVAIGTAYDINSLVTGTAVPPTANTAGSPWPSYAYNQAIALVLFLPTIAGLDYTLAVYNCAGHILIRIAPDQPAMTYFEGARSQFGLLQMSSGVIASSSDQGTSNSFQVPESLGNLTIGDLNFLKTPWGREYVAYAQDFGSVAGLS